MDNHESHVSLAAIELAKSSGIILLTFHPHTSHKMQPLDRTVFGPFKTYYNAAINNWMLSPGNSGKPVSIYDIAALAGQAYPRAFTPSNITKGFQVSGFVPFNEQIFPDTEFLGANVTDRPIPQNIQNEDCNISADLPNHANTQNVSGQDKPSTSSFISPQMIRPHPKAEARKVASNKGKPKGKSRILTDTPEKLAIEENLRMRSNKRNKSATKQKSVKRKVLQEETSSSDGEGEPELCDESDYDASSELRDFEENVQFEKEGLEVGNFVLVNLRGKKSIRYFVAKIIDDADDVLKIKYLKMVRGKTQQFIEDDENIYDLDKEDVIHKLPSPSNAGGSARQQQYFRFGVDLSRYNVE